MERAIVHVLFPLTAHHRMMHAEPAALQKSALHGQQAAVAVVRTFIA